MEAEHFEPPSFRGFADAVVDHPGNPQTVIRDRGLQRTYVDALTDLHRLVDEYRFESLLALALLRDYVIKRDRGEAPTIELSGDERLDTMPWPVESLVLLLDFLRSPPNAAEVFNDPHKQIAGGRILSRWLAAQLIDSALYPRDCRLRPLGDPASMSRRIARRTHQARREAPAHLLATRSGRPRWPLLADSRMGRDPGSRSFAAARLHPPGAQWLHARASAAVRTPRRARCGARCDGTWPGRGCSRDGRADALLARACVLQRVARSWRGADSHDHC